MPDTEAKEAQDQDTAEAKAAQAELKRQEAVRDAVDAANAKELPKLGGPLREPGLGR